MVKIKKKSAPISIPCRLSIARLNCSVLRMPRISAVHEYQYSKGVLFSARLNLPHSSYVLTLCQLQFSVIYWPTVCHLQFSVAMYITSSVPWRHAHLYICFFYVQEGVFKGWAVLFACSLQMNWMHLPFSPESILVITLQCQGQWQLSHKTDVNSSFGCICESLSLSNCRCK